jgi:hypothetical protein
MGLSYKARVDIITGLLDGAQYCSLLCGECVDGVYSVTEISSLNGGYVVDYIVRDSIEHLDQAKVFFELLGDGWLFSGLRTVAGSTEAPSLISLDDHGLDTVLQMAMKAREH